MAGRPVVRTDDDMIFRFSHRSKPPSPFTAGVDRQVRLYRTFFNRRNHFIIRRDRRSAIVIGESFRFQCRTASKGGRCPCTRAATPFMENPPLLPVRVSPHRALSVDSSNPRSSSPIPELADRGKDPPLFGPRNRKPSSRAVSRPRPFHDPIFGSKDVVLQSPIPERRVVRTPPLLF